MLVMTRKEGAAVYGGKRLTTDFEQTFDHVLRVERIIDSLERRVVEVSVRDRRGGYAVYELTPKNNEFSIGKDIRIVMLGIHAMPVRGCGITSVVRMGFDAPRSYKIVRDDAIRRTR